MALLSLEPRRVEPLDLAVEPLDAVVADGRAAWFVGGSPTEGPAIVRVSFGAAEAEIVKRSRSDTLEPAFISAPEAISFDSGGQAVHAFYYPPVNPGFRAPAGDRAAADRAEPRRTDHRHRRTSSIPRSSSGRRAASRWWT